VIFARLCAGIQFLLSVWVGRSQPPLNPRASTMPIRWPNPFLRYYEIVVPISRGREKKQCPKKAPPLSVHGHASFHPTTGFPLPTSMRVVFRKEGETQMMCRHLMEKQRLSPRYQMPIKVCPSYPRCFPFHASACLAAYLYNVILSDCQSNHTYLVLLIFFLTGFLNTHPPVF